jgi:hypothetical protein
LTRPTRPHWPGSGALCRLGKNRVHLDLAVVGFDEATAEVIDVLPASYGRAVSRQF